MDKLSTFTNVKGKYQYCNVFGMDKAQFEKLFAHFKEQYRENTLAAYEERKLIYLSNNNGLTARLKFISDVRLQQYLHIMIYYIRHYPTFEVLGWNIGKTKQESAVIVHKWFIIFIKSLDSCKVLPARDLKNVSEVAANLLGEGVISEEELDLIVDVTEREINRPRYNQKVKYSGKKKRHTVKNTVISTVCLIILFLGKTHDGSTHDFTMLKEDCPKEEMIDNELFTNGILWADLGYQGILQLYENLTIEIPYKRKRKSKNNPNPELTEEEKIYNRSVGATRVKVENSIGGIKISKVTSHTFRGRKEGWDDDVMLVATAIYNFKKLY
jgi:hypothetical protein